MLNFGAIWAPGGYWDMQSCFPMFVWVFQAIRGVKNDFEKNMAFFAEIHRVNEAPDGETFCRP